MNYFSLESYHLFDLGIEYCIFDVDVFREFFWISFGSLEISFMRDWVLS